MDGHRDGRGDSVVSFGSDIGSGVAMGILWAMIIVAVAAFGFGALVFWLVS